MGDVTLNVFLETVGKAGPAVMLALFVWGGLQGWWVYGRYHQEIVTEKDRQYQELLARCEQLQKDRDKWIDVAMSAAHTAQHAVSVAESGVRAS